MTSPLDEYRARLRESLGIINDLKAKLATVERARTEPIAIVGMACRFPGGCVSLDAYWDGLLRGIDGIVEVPPERWPESEFEGSGNDVRWAGLIEAVDKFDASFFGISPREATSLDPQHRLLLELTWEAIEDAGVRPEKLFRSRTGVYTAMCTNDYWHRVIRCGLPAMDTYGATGNLFSTAAGRISYWLGLEGPSASIDTACSSSLVALNFAVQALRHGHCDQALVGGVNAILSPFTMTMMSRLGALSPDGRCKSFDARANGYVRGEGCGVVVLKRLADARRDGDRIRALILGSAVNQDGRSTGLTTPNVLAQQALLQQALENARVLPEDIGYVETHGTGTPLGDPIEIDALKAVLGQPRKNGSSCALGAVKTNIGHLEGAAGIAGVIKAVLCLEREAIPKNIHHRTLNPRIDLEGTPFFIPRDVTPWPRDKKPRRAGVNSFGIGGTNAHVILEEAPVDPPRPTAPTLSDHLLPISAKNPPALAELAKSFRELLAAPDGASLHDIVYTAAVRRTHHPQRWVVIARDRAEFAATLAAVESGEKMPGVIQGATISPGMLRTLFVFSGQGSQWPRMGSALLEEEPVFRAKLEEIDAVMRKNSSVALLRELRASEDESRLDETEIAQPALFAIQVGIAELLKSWGVTPNAVMGHSVGEIAAAHVSGALTLEEAVRLVILRGRIMQKATGRGKMVWVARSAEEIAKELAGLENEVSIAAINDPSSVVLSGNVRAVDAIVERLTQQHAMIRPLRVNYAFHSPQMDALAEELASSLGHFQPTSETIPIYSTVTGKRIAGTDLDARYWARNVRATVNLAGAMRSALSDGHQVIVEASPHPVLLANLEQCVTDANGTARITGTLRRQQHEGRSMLEALGALYVAGVEIDWSKLHSQGGQVVSLPHYPWQREQYWVDPHENAKSPTPSWSLPEAPDAHPLLGSDIALADSHETRVFQQIVRPNAPEYLKDHRVQGEVVFPGTGYLEMALAAAARSGHPGAFILESVELKQRLVMEESGALVQLIFEREGANAATFQIASRRDAGSDWLHHAEGTVRFADAASPEFAYDPTTECRQFSNMRSHSEHYAQMDSLGLSYGPSFRGIDTIWSVPGRALARIQLPETTSTNVHDVVHPALLDACLQTLYAAATTELKGTYVPVAIDRLELRERPRRTIWVDIRAREPLQDHPDTAEADLRVLDENGRVLMNVVGLRAKKVAEKVAPDPLDDLLHAIAWRPKPRREMTEPEIPAQGTWLVFMDQGNLGASIVSALEARGARCIRVSAGAQLHRSGPNDWSIEPANPDDYRALLQQAFPGQIACRGIIHLWSLRISPDFTTADRFGAEIPFGCMGMMFLIQALVRFGWRDPPPCMFVTRGAQAVRENEAIHVNQAPIWGMARTIALEHPELTCTRVDLEIDEHSHEASWLVQEILCADKDDQIAFRAEDRFVARLVRNNQASSPQVTALHREPAQGRAYRLWQPHPGVLERLELRSLDRKAPMPGEVEIEVLAAGLNFIDVLMAMGIYPGMKEGGTALGGEFSGRIVALGPDVEHLSLGQEVIGSIPGAFATHVTVNARNVVPKPQNVTFEQAAALPAVFMTVLYALRHIGRAQPGEKILIHSGTGGTGLAAIQLAQHLGLEIFATAGSDEKRQFLRDLGIAHVMNSRSLEWAGEIQRITHGRGVDLILNSLTGEAIRKGFDVLAPYGRFLELGKRDIYDDERIGLLPFRKSLSYSAIDLAGMVHDKPALYSALLREVAEMFDCGALQAPPVRVFPASRADEAFQFMAQARHIGKIVVTMQDPKAEIVQVGGSSSNGVHADATYLITGGLGGLGLTVAKWFVEQGARRLVLIGRNAPSNTAKTAIGAMEMAGATVRTMQADISSSVDVERVMSTIDAQYPLRGVVHAAGVLDDHSILEMSARHLLNVFAPKVNGAWNLHCATRAIPLDFFVLYSSSAGLLGSPGQGNYAAANVFLDALAWYRRAQGLPGMSIQWGPFSEVGMAAAMELRGARAGSRGIESLTPTEGLEFLRRLLARPRVEIGIMRFDIRRFRDYYPQVATSPFWSEMLTESSAAPAATTESRVRSLIEGIPPAERLGHLERFIVEQLGRVLRLPPERVGRDTPFRLLGVDSLMSLEMRNRLESDLQIKLPSTLLFTYPDTRALAEHLLTRIVVPKEEARPTNALVANDIEKPSAVSVTETNVEPEDFLAEFDASMSTLKEVDLE